MALPLSREPERSKLSAREPGGRPAAARPGAVRPPARWGRGGPGAARFGGARAGPAGRGAHFTLEFGLASGRTARRLPQGLARRPHTPRRARPARCPARPLGATKLWAPGTELSNAAAGWSRCGGRRSLSARGSFNFSCSQTGAFAP